MGCYNNTGRPPPSHAYSHWTFYSLVSPSPNQDLQTNADDSQEIHFKDAFFLHLRYYFFDIRNNQQIHHWTIEYLLESRVSFGIFISFFDASWLAI
jgi:hypothetical protein